MYRLLIVEDEDILRRWIIKNTGWEEMGYEVAGEASNGIEALKIIESTAVDVVLTDLYMPDMNGIDLMQMLHANHPHICIVVLSAYNSFEHARKAIQYGAFEFVSKPLDEEELESVFNRLSEKLGQRKAEMRKKSLMETGLLLDQGIVQDAFITALLTGKLDTQFIVSSIRQLGMDFYENCFCIAAVDFDGLDGNHDFHIKQEFLRLSAAFLKPLGHSFAWMGDKFVLLMSSKNSCAFYDFNKTVINYKDQVDNGWAALPQNHRTAIGLSRLSSGFENIQQAYSEALQALNYSFYEGEGTIVSYGDIQPLLKARDIPRTERQMEHISKLCELLVEAVVNQEEMDIRLKAGQFFAALAEARTGDITLLKIKVMEFFLQLDGRFKTRDLSLPRLSQKQHIYRIILSMRSMDRMKSWFLCLLGELLQEVRMQKRTVPDMQDISGKVKEYVAKNMDKKLSLAELSEAMHVNLTYLCTLFKKEQGTTLVNYITQMKIEKAKEYLEKPAIRIQDISEMLGFSDYRYFCTTFRKETGMTPMKYRSQKLVKR